MTKNLTVKSSFEPAGSQPKAIETLVHGLNDGLLHQVLLGVTGSGKTIVYFHAIKKILDKSRQCLILLPEIGLISQFEKKIYGVFWFLSCDMAFWNKPKE